MTKEDEVEKFLREFKVKMGIWDIIFRDDRGKNTQALLDLELRPVKRKEIIANLNLTDFSEGPLDNWLFEGSKMWVFGVEYKKQEIYIKITLGYPGSNVLCISFHVAEHPMTFPFKLK